MPDHVVPRVEGLDHLVLIVADVDRTVQFYVDGLGMRAEVFQPADGSRRTALCFGGQKINLHPADTPFAPHADTPKAGSGDLCFLSSVAVADWTAHFERLGVTVIEGPVTRTGATGPILSIYVRDPDGNLLEIANSV